jgi:transaldolase / glucose-6-phosphate isomerase
VADEPPAEDAAGYGPDRVFVHLRNDEAPDPAHDARLRELATAGHPTIVMGAMGAADLGRLFYFAEFATAVAGWVLEVDPFDHPDAEAAGDATRRALEGDAPAPDDGDLAAVLGPALAPPGYLAVMSYLPTGDDVDAAVARLRAAVLRERAVATTFAHGPRLGRAAGRPVAGGPPAGRVLQLVEDGAAEEPVPGRPSGFRSLLAAQADAELQALRDRGLPAARVRIPAGDVVAGIDSLTTKV